MNQEVLVIRSSISSQLLKTTLFRGFAIACIGLLVLLVAGSLFPVDFLHTWGWILFLLGLGCITYGMLPYRSLSRLQMKPDELILLDSNHIAFSRRGRKLLTLPIQSIAHISYISHPQLYGIAMRLKTAPIDPIRIHQSSKEIERIRRQGDMHHADLFFPYFNQRGYNELLEWTEEKEEKEEV
jgi:hypothetical protein